MTKYTLFYEEQGDIYWDYVETEGPVSLIIDERIRRIYRIAVYYRNDLGEIGIREIWAHEIRQIWAEKYES